ncbi:MULTISPECIES: aspartyl-phosphate phosphatase Spo0E family protein [Bacillales]|uniref:Aspartyl-phosphate phosphatase Spo0E family protein n=2 Tax=Sporosarcina TaxID=1569 RepID=A0ABW0TVY8_9BACL|nr:MULTISPECIES: aspartyl-phosphate phosphatase Spo0E family protein [Bacillales]MCM3637773.1 aspartyl-phosphate phosphatase Spo0E family protein [Sporosarcina luteola]MCM3709839.1 aspartyl-phosphate phosphatase Spo0E family protein [Sporosarcina luteola]
MRLIGKQLLSFKIHMKRSKMVKIAKDRGFTHPAVVACSQELDSLLNRYQNIA